jgi:hypothetical protein
VGLAAEGVGVAGIAGGAQAVQDVVGVPEEGPRGGAEVLGVFGLGRQPGGRRTRRRGCG